MNLYQEFAETLAWAVMTFVIGITLRELAVEAVDAWLGRINVFAAISLLAMFGFHATRTCEVFYAVERAGDETQEPATEIAKRDAMPADYSITLSDGSVFSVRSDNGTFPGVLRRGGSERIGGGSSRARSAGSQADRGDELRYGTHDAGGVVWIGSEQTDGNQTF